MGLVSFLITAKYPSTYSNETKRGSWYVHTMHNMPTKTMPSTSPMRSNSANLAIFFFFILFSRFTRA